MARRWRKQLRPGGVDPQVQADEMVVRFEQTWSRLHVDYDDFIRTTEARHIREVQAILRDLWAKGEIYFGDYEGWYCVPDERFWTQKDLVNGCCPDCGRPVQRLVELNYFFRMSAYQGWLIDYINEHPTFIQPVMPERTEVLWHRLGWPPPTPLGGGLVWGVLRPGSRVVPGPQLFPRDVAAPCNTQRAISQVYPKCRLG